MNVEPLKILDDTFLAGPAATFEELRYGDDMTLAAAIGHRMREHGLGVSGARSLPDLRRIIDRLRGRKLRHDLGVHPVEVDWLRFHVPPGGTAQLTVEQQVARTGGVSLKFMGLGFGSGRSLTLAVVQDFGTREDCFSLGAKLDVRLRNYAERDGREMLQVDVERAVGTYLVSRESCRLCFRAPALGPQPRTLQREWDLGEDPHGLTETVRYEHTDTSDIEIGLEVPGVDLGKLTPGLTISRSISSTCVATYTFPGRACFRSYTEVVPGTDFPFWGRS